MDSSPDNNDLPPFFSEEQLRQVGKNLKHLSQMIGAAVRRITEFRDEWSAIAPVIGQAIVRAAEELPKKMREAYVNLAKHGWYVDQGMSLSDPPRLGREIAEPAHAANAEAELQEHFRSNLDRIENEICEQFPERAHIIRAAFEAHRLGQYVLSVPVFLAQADGICFERCQAYYFMREKRGSTRPGTAVHASSDEHDFWTAIILLPLGMTGPLNVSKNGRDPEFSGLNRHTVMHGDSLDYGVEVNSLKAISFLNYVSQALTRMTWSERISQAKSKLP
ncbi:hypothetical protein AB4Z27_28095 [Cupriavidus sp. KB_39]|uniref:hypothetical protein n=1 Tax=Cupriavidus sp. KB_39 TaxID=3233036 RepID=UPI003F8E7688